MGSTRALNPSVAEPLGRQLGPVIAEVREEQRMSAEELAGLAGVSPKAVEHWEAGRRIINNESLPRVARALGTMPSKLYARAERRGEGVG